MQQRTMTEVEQAPQAQERPTAQATLLETHLVAPPATMQVKKPPRPLLAYIWGRDSIPVATLTTLVTMYLLMNVVFAFCNNSLLQIVRAFSIPLLTDAVSNGFPVLACVVTFFASGRAARCIAPHSASWGIIPVLAFYAFRCAAELHSLLNMVFTTGQGQMSLLSTILMWFSSAFLIVGAVPCRKKSGRIGYSPDKYTTLKSV